MPEINWLLAVACIALVVVGGELVEARRGVRHRRHRHDGDHVRSSSSSSRARRGSGRSRKALPLLLFFLAFDLPFFVANVLKFLDGGYVPILVGAVFFTVMVVWRRGRRMLADALRERTMPVDEFLAESRRSDCDREASRARSSAASTGTGVVMASHADGRPAGRSSTTSSACACSTRTSILLTIVTAHVPYIAARQARDGRDARRRASTA